jgi:hypothetical protein
LSIIGFIYQLNELTLEFTEFKTTISVEFINYDINQSNIAAYSLCTYQLDTDTIGLPKKI